MATHTVVGSATKTVVIGDDRPFVIIGERINPTGRKILMEEMKAGDFSRVERDTIAQVEAGAHMLDVNAGIPLADEPAILARTIQLVQSLTDVPLSIDSSIVEALEAGAVERLEIGERVFGHDHQIGQLPDLNGAHGRRLSARFIDFPGPCNGGSANDLQRRQARLAEHFKFADIGEAPGLVDIARIATRGNASAAAMNSRNSAYTDTNRYAVIRIPIATSRAKPVSAPLVSVIDWSWSPTIAAASLGMTPVSMSMWRTTEAGSATRP